MLLTDDDLARLGSNFDRALPVNHLPCFEELLAAIDEAESASQIGNGTEGSTRLARPLPSKRRPGE
jgi:hypothetical protein